jgi:DNA-binding response OmpR family regulator/GGDEF domain-containing protein
MSKGKILTVDDEHFFRVLYEDLLGGEGYTVCAVEDGGAAIGVLETEPFDVVVMDVIMPGEDGVRTAERIKERWPDVEILLVTSLRDVKVAVSAMQRGASDFLTKPLNPDELLAVVARLFERSAAAREHHRLLDENIFYLESLGVYHRGLRILDTLDLDEVGEAILERLLSETSAQGAVLWLPHEENPDRLHLHSVRGLVAPEREPREISWKSHPLTEWFKRGEPCHDPESGGEARDELAQGNAFYLPLLDHGQPALLIKVTDKVGGNQFGPEDLRKALILGPLAVTGVRNARTHRRLARRSVRDPRTQAYDIEFFKNYLQAEINKSARFKRTFSLLDLRINNIAELRKAHEPSALKGRIEDLMGGIARAIREIDLVGRHHDDEFYILLPETDYLGSLVLKRRITESLLHGAGSPTIHMAVASASFPRDGDNLKQLFRTLKARLMREQSMVALRKGLESQPHWEVISTLLAADKGGLSPDGRLFGQREGTILRRGLFPEAYFTRLQQALLEEIERDPVTRGIAYLGLGDLRESAALRAPSQPDGMTATRVFALGSTEDGGKHLPEAGNRWVTPLPIDDERIRQHRFALFLTEDTAYAFYGRRTEKGLQAFHTADPGLVENLIFKLQKEHGLQFQL